VGKVFSGIWKYIFGHYIGGYIPFGFLGMSNIPVAEFLILTLMVLTSYWVHDCEV
jgi:hypothetical protein